MGGGAPKADPQIGVAAKMSAQTGQDMLDWMKTQAEITNQWAETDRDRQQSTFIPLQDAFIKDAQNYDTAPRRTARSNMAAADVAQGFAGQRDARRRDAAAMGIDPRSGRYQGATAKLAGAEALATAGARNLATRQVESEGRALKGDAINLGAGLGVNPATSIGLSNNAAQSGFSGAQQGYGQQGSLLNTQYQNQMQAWQANQGALGALGGAFGKVIGALPFMPSSKKLKTDKTPFNALGAIRKTPVEKWRYKPGVEDEGEHVGAYAEDFKKATGLGDGKSISPIDMMGVTLGAVRELDKKISKMERMAA